LTRGLGQMALLYGPTCTHVCTYVGIYVRILNGSLQNTKANTGLRIAQQFWRVRSVPVSRSQIRDSSYNKQHEVPYVGCRSYAMTAHASFFSNYLENHKTYRKTALDIKRIFRFALQLSSETFCAQVNV
jgi:hypothetical protein